MCFRLWLRKAREAAGAEGREQVAGAERQGQRGADSVLTS